MTRWAYNPWASPVAYGWGWGGSPWYGYYGAYFQPYPYYAAPSLWLTDYLIAANLQAAYEAGQASAGGSASIDELGALAYGGGYESASDTVSTTAKLTPELKQQIADEVKAGIGPRKKSRLLAELLTGSPCCGRGRKTRGFGSGIQNLHSVRGPGCQHG